MNFKSIAAVALAAVFMPLGSAAAEKIHTLSSPDGKIEVSVRTGGKVTYSVSRNGVAILGESAIGMTLQDGTVFGSDTKAPRCRKGRVAGLKEKAVVYKKSVVETDYNFMVLSFKGCDLEFRAFDNGVAYRFVSTAKKGDFNVEKETAEFNFAQDWTAWVPYANTSAESFERQFLCSFENYYQHISLSEWDKARLAFLPVVVDAPDGMKVLITEADLYDYPGMFLNGQGGTTLTGFNAPCPKDVEVGGHNMLQGVIKSRESFIAKARAGQSFPWRIVAIVPEAKDLPNLDLVWQLSRPAAADADFSWIKPGKVAWDWWNAWNLYGVDFRAGINNDTYKYYIDFASANGIEYVILDEGWAVNKKTDLYQVVPEINLPELSAYAASKNVGLILWAGYKAVDKDIEGIFKHYSEMGIKGFKIDFMDRDDQQVMQFYENCARLGAKYHLVIDFHGAFKPQGLQRQYPNVLNFEGVAGLEQMKWGKDYDQVTYDVIIPFIRMAAGPMDYTQGAMRNATKGNYRAVNSEAMSQGTRCRQLAQYAIFEAPLTMLCDSPSNYLAEPECTGFIAGFPTTWDETVPVCGEIGEYVAIARRKGDVWYVGAMTDWSARDLLLDLGFTGGSKMTVFRDGINADRAAKDYKKEEMTLGPDGKVLIHMAPGGGWAAVIRK